MGRGLMKYKGIKPVLVVIAGLTLIQSIAIILQAKWLAEVISALFAGAKLQEQAGGVGLFLLAFIVRQVCGLFEQKAAYRFAEQTGQSLRKEVLSKLFELGPRFAGQEGTGNLVTTVLEGVAKFRNYLELFLPRMLATGITPILILAYVYTLDTTSAVILTVTMPILIVFMILIGLTAKKQTERQWKTYRVLSNHFVDSLRGLETLKFLGRSKKHGDSIERVSDSYRSATMRTLRVAFLSSFALDFFTMLSVASVAVSLGLPLIDGKMTLLTALTILILAPEYFLPVRMVGADYHATLDGKEAGQAMEDIIQAAEKEAALAATVPEDAVLAWTPNSHLCLQGVGITYEEEGRPSLQDVNVTFSGLGKIGIIGESGAGKSTLIDILGGFLRPTRGSFELNGSTLGDLGASGWREQITYIPQKPYIFSSSLKDNIRFNTPDATKSEVEQAAAAAGLDSLIKDLPNGLDEPIGGGGRPLSGGQEQRVALARALLSDRPIILLDEPTAHLDIETEYELKETMLPLFEGKLVLLATHRLHWMRNMDHIIVMDQGCVAEIGTHDELMAKKGVYYQLVESQREGIQ
ncbi:ATP-binding cassette, subfamily C, CydD [Fontibacillus panacisegetis]|uniref:ATP-binding cassette, subfamily C, CydD n=1 Tax=Fontibacillus panacisegetis TaxID=670482 RepID=A0A1G7M9C5_9BACL|nr:thiol reductant ABC exporter subunit CydD [Fontibacillus panacisegetis]SDF58204.1 ATP-binding cassette, subfamily C, CydD [Fontibacillus panacisegetis]